MFDIGLEYDSKIKDIEFLIYKLGNVGFDCTNLVDALNKIEEETNISLDNIRNNKEINTPTRHMLLDGVYGESLGKLKKLELTISEEEKYYKVIGKLSSLSSSINVNILSKLEVDNYVNGLIECIELIRNSSVKDHREKEKVVGVLYEIVYRMIKIELKLTGESKLLEYCNLYDIDTSHLNELVLDDIESKKEDSNSEEVKNAVNKLNALDEDYVDKGLIILLNDVNVEEEFESVKASLKEIISKYNKNNSEISMLEEQKDKLKKQFNEEHKSSNIKFNLKYLCANIGSFMLSIGMIFGFIKVTSGPTKHYRVTTTTYNVNDDSYMEESEYKSSRGANQVYLKFYEPYVETNDGYKREATTYRLNYAPIYELKDYLDHLDNIDMSTFSARMYREEETKEELELSDMYNETLALVVEKKQDLDDYIMKVDKNTAFELRTSIFILLFALEIIIANGNTKYFSLGLIASLKYIIHYIKAILEKKEYSKSELKELNHHIRIIDEEIKKLAKENKELDRKYKEYMSSYGKKFDSLLEETPSKGNENKELAKEYKEYMSLHGKKFDSSLEEASSMGMVRRLGK